MALENPSSRFLERRWSAPHGAAGVWLEVSGRNVELHAVSPNGSERSIWARCTEQGCLGEMVSQGRCFRHAGPNERREYVRRQKSDRRPISLRGVVSDEAVLRDAFGELVVRGGTFQRIVSLSGSKIIAPLQFDRVNFEGQLSFHGAVFSERLEFRGCQFQETLNSSFAYFDAGPPSWNECEFKRQINLSFVHARDVSIGLEGCKFSEGFLADGIAGPILLRDSEIDGPVSLANAATSVVMEDAILLGPIDLSGAQLKALHANGAKFLGAFQVGPAVVEYCYLNRAMFKARVRIELESDRLELNGANFQDGGSILLRDGEVSLEQLSAGRQLLFAGSQDVTRLPRILSLRDADVGSMRFARVSMKECKLYGAHNLAGLSLESTVELPTTPRFWSVRRRCVADEIHWRASRSGPLARPWRSLMPRSEEADRLARWQSGSPAPGQIQSVYRDLRRGREGQADQPGAADFYYGEMEMRRRDKTAPTADRLVVTLYWLASGYGLRAARPLVALSAMLFVATILVRQSGFVDGAVDWATAALFTFRHVLPGIRRSPLELTHIGESVEITIGFFGPVFLALFALALRGRIKR